MLMSFRKFRLLGIKIVHDKFWFPIIEIFVKDEQSLIPNNLIFVKDNNNI